MFSAFQIKFTNCIYKVLAFKNYLLATFSACIYNEFSLKKLPTLAVFKVIKIILLVSFSKTNTELVRMS